MPNTNTTDRPTKQGRLVRNLNGRDTRRVVGRVRIRGHSRTVRHAGHGRTFHPIMTHVFSYGNRIKSDENPRYLADDRGEMSSSNVVRVAPVDHPTSPLNRARRAGVDARRPQAELDTSRGAGIFVTTGD